MSDNSANMLRQVPFVFLAILDKASFAVIPRARGGYYKGGGGGGGGGQISVSSMLAIKLYKHRWFSFPVIHSYNARINTQYKQKCTIIPHTDLYRVIGKSRKMV